MKELIERSDGVGLVQAVRAKEVSPVEVVEAYLKKIEQRDAGVQAWVTVTADRALEQAKKLEAKIAAGEPVGLLAGLPFSAKDIYYTQGIKTTAGSKVLEHFVPDYTATSIARLEAEDAILLGKNTTVEFAAGGTTHTRNPWNTLHTPGGSSSGSSAAVAAGMSGFSLGSQTAGSLLRPAAFCGLVSLKATLGRISRYGVIFNSWSLDHIGAMTKSVRDQSLVAHVLSGYDELDPISLPMEKIKKDVQPPGDLSRLRIGVPTSYFFDDTEPEVAESVRSGIRVLAKHGADVREVELPETFELSIMARNIIANSENSTVHHNLFQTKRELYGPVLRKRIAAGTIIPQLTYLKALRIRSIYIQQMREMMRDVDVLIVPTAPHVAPPAAGNTTGDPRFNSPFTLAGFPALTVPCGLSSAGLPIGMQIVGKPLTEELLLQVAAYYEQIYSLQEELTNVGSQKIG